MLHTKCKILVIIIKELIKNMNKAKQYGGQYINDNLIENAKKHLKEFE